MGFRRSRYYLGEAVRNLIRNRLMTVASIFTVASCLFVVSIFYILAANVDTFLAQIEDSVELVVFIENDITQEGVQALHDRIADMEYVRSLAYISFEEAFERALGRHEDPSTLDGVPLGTFPHSFEIELADIRYHAQVVETLESIRHMGIYSIQNAQDLVQTLIAISNMVRWVSMGLIFVLAGSSIVIITNTITITVNARRVDINIMKYVGATDWFIRWPFLMEGILIGILGSLPPVAAVFFGYPRIIQATEIALEFVEFIEFSPPYEIYIFLFPFVICLGVFIGALGSGFAVRKHLQV